jgi:hypothetical protein
MGSPTVASFVGYWAFWILLVYGFAVGELTPKIVGAFIALWVIGRIALTYAPWEPAHAMFGSYAAILAIALVFMIFKKDVRVT